MPSATLTAPASEWSEHCGTMCVEIATGPSCRIWISDRAVTSRPAWQGAPMTPCWGRSFATDGVAAIASSTARSPTTVCSSQ